LNSPQCETSLRTLISVAKNSLNSLFIDVDHSPFSTFTCMCSSLRRVIYF
jgi:hypothetical protein